MKRHTRKNHGNIDELEKIAKAATPGPWGDPEKDVHIGDFGWLVFGCPAGETADTEQGHADAKFIAAANPAAVLELIAEIRKAQALDEKLRAALTESLNHQLEFKLANDALQARVEVMRRVVEAARKVTSSNVDTFWFNMGELRSALAALDSIDGKKDGSA